MVEVAHPGFRVWFVLRAFFEAIVVDLRHPQRLVTHADAVVDHQRRQLVSVDEHNAPSNLIFPALGLDVDPSQAEPVEGNDAVDAVDATVSRAAYAL